MKLKKGNRPEEKKKRIVSKPEVDLVTKDEKKRKTSSPEEGLEQETKFQRLQQWKPSGKWHTYQGQEDKNQQIFWDKEGNVWEFWGGDWWRQTATNWWVKWRPEDD